MRKYELADLAQHDEATALTTRQRTILGDLVALILREGFGGWSVEDFAAELGCSKSTLYAIAASKEQLMRAAVVEYFRGVAERVEARLTAMPASSDALRTYLLAVADELQPASSRFLLDVTSFAPARQVYELNTRLAADRVRALIADGVRAGRYRKVDGAFVGVLTATMMSAIQRGEVGALTGQSDGAGYKALAEVVLNGIIGNPKQ